MNKLGSLMDQAIQVMSFCGMSSSLEIYFYSGRSFFLEAKTGRGSQPRFFVVDYQSVDLQGECIS